MVKNIPFYKIAIIILSSVPMRVYFSWLPHPTKLEGSGLLHDKKGGGLESTVNCGIWGLYKLEPKSDKMADRAVEKFLEEIQVVIHT